MAKFKFQMANVKILSKKPLLFIRHFLQHFYSFKPAWYTILKSM